LGYSGLLELVFKRSKIIALRDEQIKRYNRSIYENNAHDLIATTDLVSKEVVYLFPFSSPVVLLQILPMMIMCCRLAQCHRSVISGRARRVWASGHLTPPCQKAARQISHLVFCTCRAGERPVAKANPAPSSPEATPDSKSEGEIDSE